jgi:hypothetical protein
MRIDSCSSSQQFLWSSKVKSARKKGNTSSRWLYIRDRDSSRTSNFDSCGGGIVNRDDVARG